MSTISDFHRTHAPKGHDHTIVLYFTVSFFFFMKAVFTQHLATFNVYFWDTLPNNPKDLFKGHEITLYKM